VPLRGACDALGVSPPYPAQRRLGSTSLTALAGYQPSNSACRCSRADSGWRGPVPLEVSPCSRDGTILWLPTGHPLARYDQAPSTVVVAVGVGGYQVPSCVYAREALTARGLVTGWQTARKRADVDPDGSQACRARAPARCVAAVSGRLELQRVERGANGYRCEHLRSWLGQLCGAQSEPTLGHLSMSGSAGTPVRGGRWSRRNACRPGARHQRLTHADEHLTRLSRPASL
jgi:hypothetical protein